MNFNWPLAVVLALNFAVVISVCVLAARWHGLQ
jgi:hypothetical protein